MSSWATQHDEKAMQAFNALIGGADYVPFEGATRAAQIACKNVSGGLGADYIQSEWLKIAEGLASGLIAPSAYLSALEAEVVSWQGTP